MSTGDGLSFDGTKKSAFRSTLLLQNTSDGSITLIVRWLTHKPSESRTMHKFRYIVKPDPHCIPTTFHKSKVEAWRQVLNNIAKFGAHLVTVKHFDPDTKEIKVVYLDVVG